MAASGEKPERLPELAIVVQIDTTLHRSGIRISHGFQRFGPLFNRTAVEPDKCRFFLRLQRVQDELKKNGIKNNIV
jgi:hypothetical protein